MLARVSAAATMIATEIPMSAPDGRCTATGRGCGCVLAGDGDGVLPERGRCGRGRRAGRARWRGAPVVVGGPGAVVAAGRCQQQDPAGVDEAGVGEGVAVGLGFAGVEAEQLVPALAVAQEPGGDLPQVISGHDPVGPGPGGGSVPAAAACADLAVAALGGWPGISGAATAVLAVSAACSDCEERGAACGTCNVVRTVAPMTAAATAWNGAMTGRRGAGCPARAAAASMSTAAAASGPQHPGREGQPVDDGAVAERAGQERLQLRPGGQVAGQRPAGEADQRVRRPGQHGGDDGESGGGAGQAPQPGGRAGHGSTPLMPSSGVAVAVAWTVIACSPAASRICIGWTMVTVTVTAFPVTLAVPVVPMPAR